MTSRRGQPADEALCRAFWEQIVGWFSVCGRDLPWRHAPGAYEVWVSEIMLHQTQVATVLPYYRRWMAKFPDIESLAGSPVDEVLAVWAGLGYYRRARYLHDGARYIVEQCGGAFPTTIESLRAIPGVGEYTAGAIASFAFGQNVPAVDGNAERVFSRFFDIEGDIGRGAARRRLWEVSRRVAQLGRASDMNQAVMDLGASLCGRVAQCPLCPLLAQCAAYRFNKTSILPQKRKPPEKTGEYHVALVIMDSEKRFLIARRAPGVLLGGLWQFPMVLMTRAKANDIRTKAQKMRACAHDTIWNTWFERAGCTRPCARDIQIPAVEHIFTHIRMIVSIDVGFIDTLPARNVSTHTNQTTSMTPTESEPYDAYTWADFAQISRDFAISTLMKKMMARLKGVF